MKPEKNAGLFRSIKWINFDVSQLDYTEMLRYDFVFRSAGVPCTDLYTYWVHRFPVFFSGAEYFRFCRGKCFLYGHLTALFGKRCHISLCRVAWIFLGERRITKKKNKMQFNRKTKWSGYWVFVASFNISFSLPTRQKLVSVLCVGIAPAAMSPWWLTMFHNVSSV